MTVIAETFITLSSFNFYLTPTSRLFIIWFPKSLQTFSKFLGSISNTHDITICQTQNIELSVLFRYHIVNTNPCSSPNNNRSCLCPTNSPKHSEKIVDDLKVLHLDI